MPGVPIDNAQNGICETAAKMLDSGKLVAAICFGPQFLGRSGILDRYRYTTSCSAEKYGVWAVTILLIGKTIALNEL